MPFSANLRKRCPNLSLPKPALKSLSPMDKGLIGVGMVLTSTGRLQGIGRILPEGTKSSVFGFLGSGDFFGTIALAFEQVYNPYIPAVIVQVHHPCHRVAIGCYKEAS